VLLEQANRFERKAPLWFGTDRWIQLSGLPTSQRGQSYLALMSARVGLLRLHRAGLIELPAPSGRNGNGRPLVHGPAAWPEPVPLVGRVEQLSGLRLEAVTDKRASRLWNGLIDRYHYLGYTPLPGAQLRYLIHCDHAVLGAIGFGAAAWKVAARDRWIGWEAPCREAHLGRVLNNARFLMLPWVQVKNLASTVLALAAKRMPEDFAARYGERVVLLETLGEKPTLSIPGACNGWHETRAA